MTCLCFRKSCFVSGRKGRVRKYVLFWGCFTNYYFGLLVRRDCGRKMFYFVHCNISQECMHRTVEVQVFARNDLPTESLLSAPYVNVFCFLFFFPGGRRYRPLSNKNRPPGVLYLRKQGLLCCLVTTDIFYPLEKHITIYDTYMDHFTNILKDICQVFPNVNPCLVSFEI